MDCFNRREPSIRQSVQNGQFLCRLAQNASDLFVASHTDKRIERLRANVVTTTLSVDQTPTLQPIEPADDCSAGHAHIGSNLGYRERLTVNVAKRHAQGDEESLQAGAKALA